MTSRSQVGKLYCGKKFDCKKEVADIENVFITTTMKTDRLSALERLPPPPTTTSLIGAIKLCLTRTIFYH
jgi:hypothetical protein